MIFIRHLTLVQTLGCTFVFACWQKLLFFCQPLLRDSNTIFTVFLLLAMDIIHQQTRTRQAKDARRLDSATKHGCVSTIAGIVELAQALCGSSSPVLDKQPSRKGKGTSGFEGADVAAVSSGKGWEWAEPLALARPLFDVLPVLLAVVTTEQVEGGLHSASSEMTASVEVGDAAEYSLWLTMDLLGTVLRRWGNGAAAAEKLYERSRAGEHSETVLACVKQNPSPQTRQVFRLSSLVCRVFTLLNFLVEIALYLVFVEE